jgi:hypothetical protein
MAGASYGTSTRHKPNPIEMPLKTIRRAVIMMTSSIFVVKKVGLLLILMATRTATIRVHGSS